MSIIALRVAAGDVVEDADLSLGDPTNTNKGKKNEPKAGVSDQPTARNFDVARAITQASPPDQEKEFERKREYRNEERRVTRSKKGESTNSSARQ